VNLKIAYALMKEFPLPRIIAALESAGEEPPPSMKDDAQRIAALLSDISLENDQVLRDVARLLITTQALTGQLAMRSPAIEGLLENEAVSNALDMLKTAGIGVLHVAEQKTEHRIPVLSRLLKMCQEEISSR